MLMHGKPSPNLKLAVSEDKSIDLSKPGSPVVLFFYPKAFSKICTDELCQVRDNYYGFESLNAVVLGISRDPETVQEKFKSNHGLPFPLISDKGGKVAKAFGVGVLWGLVPATYRATFVIDKNGIIQMSIKNMMDATIHSKSALAVLNRLHEKSEPSIFQ